VCQNDIFYERADKNALKILHYLRKKQKIHIGMLNYHINYIFIDIITIHHYIHL